IADRRGERSAIVPENQRLSFRVARLEIIDRQKESPGEPVNSSFPTYHFNSTQIRRQWATIRRALDQNKVPTFAASDGSPVAPEAMPVEVGKNSIKLTHAVNEAVGTVEPAPILIATAFHPKWRRAEAE
ncbi:MAG: hypothetical protein J2P21_25625, partial [Chloracidobacterium sp.]|nr:hypothetical protein [Chloracidobacterium sp.]